MQLDRPASVVEAREVEEEHHGRHGEQGCATGILSEEMTADREELVELLAQAYWMEIETVMSYIANSINPDGVRARSNRGARGRHPEELGHARQFGERIKELYGVVPGSLEFRAEQSYLQPPDSRPTSST